MLTFLDHRLFTQKSIHRPCQTYIERADGLLVLKLGFQEFLVELVHLHLHLADGAVLRSQRRNALDLHGDLKLQLVDGLAKLLPLVA